MDAVVTDRRPWVAWRNPETGMIVAGQFDTERIQQALTQRLCAYCGGRLGYRFALVGNAAAVERRLFGRPPLHPECVDACVATEMFEDPELYTVIVRRFEAEIVIGGEHGNRFAVRSPKPISVTRMRGLAPIPVDTGA